MGLKYDTLPTGSPWYIAAAEIRDQGRRHHVDEIDGNHRADRSGGIDLCPLLNIPGQSAVEGATGYGYTGVAQNQNPCKLDAAKNALS